jgi:acetyl-CoA carboxylase carboxyltransferase component
VTLAFDQAGIPISRSRGTAVEAGLGEIDGRPVAMFRLAGGRHRGSIGPADGATIARCITQAIELRIPVIGILSTSGADIHEGVASLHAWGRIARAIADASGVVPVLLAVTGPCLSGPALLLGMADHVVMTADAYAFVSGPDAVTEFTGVPITAAKLGGQFVHDHHSGIADLSALDEDDALAAIAELLSYLPQSAADDPPRMPVVDPIERDCEIAPTLVPARATASYDVREVVGDVLDDGSLLEVRPHYAANLVTGYGRLGGRAVGFIANQPQMRAGTLDIEASRKAARFVQHCDTFNLPILTFVDTPGFEPGRDLEWRGMIRHGAELVHAYCRATVPRVCIVLRKAYGGAYIVMDSKGVGNDICLAWPTAEIAVLGAPPAVRILFRRRLDSIDDADERARETVRLEDDYTMKFATALVAAERGLVDEVVSPVDTRRRVGAALAGIRTKRDRSEPRRHSNSPL